MVQPQRRFQKKKETEKIVHSMSFKEIYEKLRSLKKLYTMHKYHVYNNKYHRSSVLQTTKTSLKT